MKRLFVRIFLSVWAASAVIGAAIAIVEALRDAPTDASPADRLLREVVAREGEAILAAVPETRARRLAQFRERTGAALYLFDRSGEPTSARCPEDARALARTVGAEGDAALVHYAELLLGLRLEDGIVVARVPRRPRWARALGTDTFAVRAVIVLLVSGVFALALARQLTKPIDRLRGVTHRIAQGDLSARAAPELVGSAAEIEALARDFDAMAGRVEELVGARDRLLADVSHELGSPLARQRVALALVRKRAGIEAGPLLDQIEAEAERLGALVDEILTLRRLESDGALVVERLELAELVREVVHDAAFEAQTREVGAVFESDEQVTVRADRELLRRALDNVMRNAIRHTERWTSVDVVLRRAGPSVEILVRDHGGGVPDDQLEAMFEPLVRLDAHRDHEHRSTGLGLAIARRAIHAHGGTITAENHRDGGLLVTLRLPASEPPAP